MVRKFKDSKTGIVYYPIYLVLFSNRSKFSDMIKKFTKSDYSHASLTISGDMNDLYSFQDIPFDKSEWGSGFVRESIYGPISAVNNYFTVLSVFLTEDQYAKMSDALEFFKKNHERFSYNTLGLLYYYLKFKSLKDYSENIKNTFFCSEFVAYMLNIINMGDKNLLVSPSDILKLNNISNLGNYTVDEFTDSDLTNRTKKAFDARHQIGLKESFMDDLAIEYKIASDKAMNWIKNLDVVRSLKRLYRRDIYTGKYTSFLDWKLLYISFKQIFKSTNKNLRFKLFEIILEFYIIREKRPVNKTEIDLISEMKRIKKIIQSNEIISIDAVDSLITYSKNKEYEVFDYSKSL